jgi:hypothetical protein
MSPMCGGEGGPYPSNQPDSIFSPELTPRDHCRGVSGCAVFEQAQSLLRLRPGVVRRPHYHLCGMRRQFPWVARPPSQGKQTSPPIHGPTSQVLIFPGPRAGCSHTNTRAFIPPRSCPPLGFYGKLYSARLAMDMCIASLWSLVAWTTTKL